MFFVLCIKLNLKSVHFVGLHYITLMQCCIGYIPFYFEEHEILHF